MEATTSENAEHANASKKQVSYQQSKEAQRARRKIQRQVDRLEEQMNQLSEQQAKIEEAMSQPDVATDIAKLSDLQKELDAVSTQLDRLKLIGRWRLKS